MAGPRSCIGLQSRSEAVDYLARLGLTDREAALSISRLQPNDPITPEGVTGLRNGHCRLLPRVPVVARLPRAILGRLSEAAEARGSLADHLAARILEIVISDDLFNAILDDGDVA